MKADLIFGLNNRLGPAGWYVAVPVVVYDLARFPVVRGASV